MLNQKHAEQTNKKFSQLLDNYEYSRPKKGEFYDAEVMLVDPDRILVDLGAKTDGVVTPRELRDTDEDLVTSLNVGDQIPVYVKSPPNMLRKTAVSIQKGAEKEAWDRANALLESGKAVELEVVGKNKGGLLVKLGRLQGFVPASLVPVAARFKNRRLKEKVKGNLVGEKLLLHIIQVNPARNKLIFSMRENMTEIEAIRLKELQEGDVVEGVIVSIEDYGAFVHLMGVDGLLHISEVSWDHVDDVSDLFSRGDKIEVEVLSIDRDEKKVQLSRKRLLPTPGMQEDELDQKVEELIEQFSG